MSVWGCQGNIGGMLKQIIKKQLPYAIKSSIYLVQLNCFWAEIFSIMFDNKHHLLMICSFVNTYAVACYTNNLTWGGCVFFSTASAYIVCYLQSKSYIAMHTKCMLYLIISAKVVFTCMFPLYSGWAATMQSLPTRAARCAHNEQQCRNT